MNLVKEKGKEMTPFNSLMEKTAGKWRTSGNKTLLKNMIMELSTGEKEQLLKQISHDLGTLGKRLEELYRITKIAQDQHDLLLFQKHLIEEEKTSITRILHPNPKRKKTTLSLEDMEILMSLTPEDLRKAARKRSQNVQGEV